MVNATVDNTPVSIVLDSGESTTVPSNETWRVSIYLAVSVRTDMRIDGIGEYRAERVERTSNEALEDVTLIGGQTIAEDRGGKESSIFITGFVVNS